MGIASLLEHKLLDNNNYILPKYNQKFTGMLFFQSIFDHFLYYYDILSKQYIKLIDIDKLNNINLGIMVFVFRLLLSGRKQGLTD